MGEWKTRAARKSPATTSQTQSVHGASSSLVASSVDDESKKAATHPILSSVAEDAMLLSEARPGGEMACVERRKVHVGDPSGVAPSCSCHTLDTVS